MDRSDDPSSRFEEGKHRLLFELGHGGMGTVYLAVTRGPAGFRKLTVVKHLHADLARDLSFLEMFLAEARLTARLHHPNIVQIHGVGFDGRDYFLEMEYLAGQSLEVLWREAGEQGGIPLPDALFVLSEVLAGLHYAHEFCEGGEPLHVVHRDVSPHNVFVTYEGSVRLLDFGIAKTRAATVATRSGVLKGKIGYAAPEQARGGSVDRRADVFAVGVLLWQAIAGARMWGAATEGEIYARLERGDIPKIRDARPAVPEALASICARALAYDPDDRFPTALDFQAAIDDYLHATGARSGSRRLAQLTSAVFPGRREAVEAEIEAALDSPLPGVDAAARPPRLGANDPFPLTMSPSLSPIRGTPSGRARGRDAADDATSAESPAALRSRRLPPRRRAAARGALGVGAALAAFAAALASRRAAPRVDHPSRAPECRAALDCAGPPDATMTCRADGRCVRMDSEDCSVLASAADVASRDTVWLGAMFPTKGPDAEAFGAACVNALDVARRDFADVSGGAGSQRRRFALVACDDSADASRAAKHLVDDVRAPAVIGFRTSKEVIDLSTSIFLPSATMVVATLNQSALITDLVSAPDQPRLVWRTIPSYAQSAPPVGAIVGQLFEPELRGAGVVLPGAPLRVALLRLSTAAGRSFADAMFTTLRFNGKSALENGADFREFTLGDPSRIESKADYESAVAGLLAFRPHVVVYMDGDYVLGNVLAPLEARWPAKERYRPRYASVGLQQRAPFFQWIGKRRELRRRFLSVQLPSSLMPNAKFVHRYNELFSPKITDATAPGVVYDAFYVVAYAAHTLGVGPVTGLALSRAVRRLVPPGEPLEVGSAGVLRGFNLLDTGQSIDLAGAGTSLDFDLATGETKSDMVVTCIDADATGNAVGTRECGVVYHVATNSLQGSRTDP